jgi:hypothetical protein
MAIFSKSSLRPNCDESLPEKCQRKERFLALAIGNDKLKGFFNKLLSASK